MSDHKDKKQFNTEDLKAVKLLIGDAEGETFALDDILAEFGVNPIQRDIPEDPELDLPWPVAVRTPRTKGTVVPFPGGAVPIAEEVPAEPARSHEPAEEEIPEVDSPQEEPQPEEETQPEETEPEDDSAGEPTESEEEEPEEEAAPEEDASEAATSRKGTPEEAEQPEENQSAQEGTPEQNAPEEEKKSDEKQPDEGENRIIAFPQKKENPLTAFLKKMSRKADDYADQMFEEGKRAEMEQNHRLERLIPGTDQEKAAEEQPHRVRKPRPMDPMPEDVPPKELAREFGQGLKDMRLRGILLLCLTAAALVQILIPTGLVPALAHPMIRGGIASGLMLAGILLGMDVLKNTLSRALKGRIGMDTLALLSCGFTLADGIVLTVLPGESHRLPYTVAALAGLWMLQHGTYHKKCGLRLSCRTAGASSQPYRVTMDEGKWDGRNTYTKWSGTQEGFGSQIQVDDGAQQMFRRVCPVLLVGDVVLALLATLVSGHPENLLWGLSALFTVTAALGGAVTYGRPFHKVARRLMQSGAALAGWPGVVDADQGERVLLTDTDLFPPGYVEMNGYKVLGDFPMERVVAYTATLIRDSGSGLTKLFHDQLRALGGVMRNAENMSSYEGGMSADIRGDRVLVGSSAFMKLMEISLPMGLNVKNAVFCAINGELAGIFALNYSLPDTAFPSLEELMREKVGPVLATRDFNLIPAMLQQRFKLAADKMDFPPVERRRELSAPEQPHSTVLTALLCREGLYPFAEAVTAAKRLRWATTLGGVLCCLSSVLGMLLAAYLVAASAYGSLSPLNMLIYQVTWLAPVWFLSGWVHRF